jgi:hypothetical protein
MAKRKSTVVYTKYRQTHQKDQTKRGAAADRKRLAMPPGKRRSSKGKIHYEYRVNRTDTAFDRPTSRKRSSTAKPKTQKKASTKRVVKSRKTSSKKRR